MSYKEGYDHIILSSTAAFHQLTRTLPSQQFYENYTVSPPKKTSQFVIIEILTNFQNSFTGTFYGQLAIK